MSEVHNYSEQPDWLLAQRAAEVRSSLDLNHGEARKTLLSHELTHLLFEISYRLGGGDHAIG